MVKMSVRVFRGFQRIIAVLLVCQACSVYSERVMGVDDDEFDFDGRPGATHEFKVEIPGHSEDCFYQPVQEGAEFFARFEVLRGGDGMADFYVRDMNWQNVEAKQNMRKHEYSIQKSNAATYAVCVDNPHYGSKLVYVFIGTFIMQNWADFQMEMRNIHTLARNFSTSIDFVTEQVGEMKKSQVSTRFHLIKDWYLSTSNNYYVYSWSLAQCILVVVSAVAQVYTVRRLFRTVNVSPGHKPRA